MKIRITHIVFLLFLVSAMNSCSNGSKKTTNATDTLSQVNLTDTTKVQTPKVYFQIKKLTKVENQDQRYGTDSEALVELYINENKIDSYEDYGDGDIFDNGLRANLSSEISEKAYTIKITDPNTIAVQKTLFFEGEEKDVWTKTYSKNNSIDWKFTNCKGECED